jgi:hypothetical protein
MILHIITKTGVRSLNNGLFNLLPYKGVVKPHEPLDNGLGSLAFRLWSLKQSDII